MALVHFFVSSESRFTSCRRRKDGGLYSRGNRLLVTESVAQVTCTKCADALGITVAAPPESKHRTGTCQCCFKAQKVSKGGGTRLSLHGYVRPGVGYILGRCRGEDQLPYEVSCERTKEFCAEVREMRTQKHIYLANLMANEVESLVASVRTGERTHERGYPKRVYASVTVPRGQGETQNPHLAHLTHEKVPSFEALRAQAIQNTEATIKQMTEHIQFLTQKIVEWTKVW